MAWDRPARPAGPAGFAWGLRCRSKLKHQQLPDLRPLIKLLSLWLTSSRPQSYLLRYLITVFCARRCCCSCSCCCQPAPRRDELWKWFGRGCRGGLVAFWACGQTCDATRNETSETPSLPPQHLLPTSSHSVKMLVISWVSAVSRC